MRQAGVVKHTTIGFAVAATMLVACGGEPADSVRVPGAPAGGDARPSLPIASSTTSLAPSTSAPSDMAAATTTTTISPSPTTTVAPAAPTTVPTTTLAPASPTTVAPPATPAPTTTEFVYVAEPAEGALRSGVEGPRSLKVQQDLIALGILPATAADSKYGPGTASGVRRFQESQGLVVDGIAGPITLAALAAAVAAIPAPTTTVA